jgi:hypothetical protein
VVDEQEHLELAIRCLNIMNTHLRYDICGINNPGLANADVPNREVLLRGRVPDAVRYACRYWSTHLVSSGRDVSGNLINELHTFCNNYLLHWLETLGLLGELSPAVESLSDAVTWCNTRVGINSYTSCRE